MCDNTSEINLTKNPMMHSLTKHIEIRHHFLRDHVEKGDIVFDHVDSKYQLADIFTKPLAIEPFFNIRRELGILDISNLAKYMLLHAFFTFAFNLLFKVLVHLSASSTYHLMR